MRPYGPPLPTRHWPIWLRYLATFVLVGLVLLLQAVWSEAAEFPFLFFFSSIMVSAVLFDRGASFLATALAAGALAFYAARPQYAPSGAMALDWIGWTIFVAVALFSAGCIELLHRTLRDLNRVVQQLALAEEQKDLLLRESAHRTRNDLTQLIGIIKMEQMAARGEPRIQEKLRAIADRVYVFSQLQNRLSRSQDAEVVVEIDKFIADLCADLQSSHAA